MSRLGYSNEDFLNLLIIYGECNRIIARTCRVFADRYPNKPRPDNKTVRILLKNCLEFGSFHPKISRVKPLLDDEDVEINVLAFFAAHGEASVRDAATHLRLPFKTIHRILKKHKWKPFCYATAQHLEAGDFIRRIEFCEWFLLRTQEEDNFPSCVIWTDEAKFCKNGMFNRRNSHFWSDENPHMIRDVNFQVSWQFNVFCAVKNNRILCLHFYDENLNSPRYLDILQTVVQPALRNLPEAEQLNAWYQHDGAPPHRTRTVTNWLEATFDDRWIATNGPFLWPPRSPDLSVLDFFIWGYVKDRVYADPVTTKDNMKDRVRDAFAALTDIQIRRATARSLLKRINKCLEQEGHVFEYLLQ